jgi:GNAT superfamily N-acetyltransferase
MRVDAEIRYRSMIQGEEAKVCSLIEKVFNEFVAPDYGPEGVEGFFRFADPRALAGRAGPGQVVVVAEQGSVLVGMIEMLECDHISLLFVSRRGEGVAKGLVRTAVEECRRRKPDLKRITVNSSPFAEPVYRRMGFEEEGPFQKKHGIIFKPMARDVE